MASTSKPTGVHYSLVFFVLLSIVCGVGWFLAYKGKGSIGELNNELVTAQKAKATAETALRTALEQQDQTKKLIGTNFSDYGTDTSNPNTTLGDMLVHMQKYGPGLAQPTYNDTIVKLADALRNVTLEREKKTDEIKTMEVTLHEQDAKLNAMLAEEKKARQRADEGKTNADNIHSEELKKKTDDINELRTEMKSTQQEYDQYKEGAEKRIKDADSRISQLLLINQKVRDELEQKTRVSFDQANGRILMIDAVAQRVWIDLGEADGLRPRTTFSVYRKNHSGVGRGARPNTTGPEDIKGAIEVTRIMGPHEAEARIIEEDIYHPIAKLDPIFSPLFRSGRGEAFSVIGIVDLDGDGKSDRDTFHEAIAAAGATIDNEVDDNGKLFVNGKDESGSKPQLSERTKFLVMGNIPDIGEAVGPEEKANALKIEGLRKELTEQARERGIRIVSLNDFLAFIGYKSQRRLYVPGGDAPYTLQDSSRQLSTERIFKSGKNSGAYSGDKNLKIESFRGGAVGGSNYRSGK